MREKGSASCARRVQGGAGERTGNQDAECDRQADAKAGDGFESTFLIDGRSENDEHQEKSCNAFESHRRPAGKIARKLRNAKGNGAPGLFRDDYLQEKRGSGGAGDLRDPIQNGIDRVHAFGNPEADGDGGIEVSAGNVAEGGNHDGDGEAVREGDAEKTESACAVQVLIGADRAGAEENQREGSDEFGDQFLPCAVHENPPCKELTSLPTG